MIRNISWQKLSNSGSVVLEKFVVNFYQHALIYGIIIIIIVIIIPYMELVITNFKHDRYCG